MHIPSELRVAIEEAGQRSGRDFSSVASELLGEAVKMRRIPGITFTDGVKERVPQLVGSGLEVFEIIAQYRATGDNWEQLRQEFPWLTDSQLHAALAYAAAYPEDVVARLHAEDALTPERVWASHPFMKPPWR